MGARALIAASALLAAACGPRPRVESARLRRSGDKTVVDVTVANSGGEGEASLTVRLRERSTGAVYVKTEDVPLQPGEPAAAAMELAVPEGDYEVTAEARDPP